MSKLRAFFLHTLISVAIVMPVCCITFFVWYPQPYFRIVDAWYLIAILVSVNFIAGPLLTLIVFRSGKPGLTFDLYFIGLVQLAALGYGTTVIYQERPYFLVFAVDRFEILPKKDVDIAAIRFEALNHKPFIGTVPVIARLPEDPEELSDFTAGVIFDGRPDLERRSEYWHPYADYALEVADAAQALDELLTGEPEVVRLASASFEKFGRDHARLGFLPVVGRTSDHSMVLDLETGEQLEILPVDPFQYAVRGPTATEAGTQDDAGHSG